MPAVKRVRLNDILEAPAASALSSVSSWRGLAMVTHAWLFIILACALAEWLVLQSNYWVLIILIPIVGGRQLGLAILMHDAAHGLLHNHRKTNDWVGQWLCGAPIGVSLASYRRYHLTHHRFTQQPEDPDLPLSAPFPVAKASLCRKVLRDLTGLTFIKQRSATFFAAISGRGALSNASSIGNEQLQDLRQSLKGFVVFNTILTVVLIALGWSVSVWLWWLSLATWFPLALRLRNIAEHACAPAGEDPFSHARTTGAGWFMRSLIAPYWVNFHAEHHLFMNVPCYRLPEVHKALMEKGYASRMTLAPDYSAVLRQVTL